MNRPAALAVVGIIAALLGGAAALAIGKATGWIDTGTTQTVVIPAPEPIGSPTPAAVEQEAARPLSGNGFDPALLYRERAAGVVTIYALFGDHAATGNGDTAQGSGFVASADGYVLTNAHVITTAGEGLPGADPKGAEQVFVQFRDGDRVPAEIVGWDLFSDIGVLRTDPEKHSLSPVPLGDSTTAVVGEPVAAIGSPFGNDSSLSVGVVSATQRSIESLTSRYSLVDAIQIDAPINRGNSGGPLFNAAGEVIGVNAQIRSQSGNAEGVGFAVPINTARRSMDQLIATGRVRYAWLGVSTQTLTPSLAQAFELPVERGAVVQCVVDESPAAASGLRGGSEEEQFEGVFIRPDGDLVVGINGVSVETAEDLVRAISLALLPGQTADLTIVRDGERQVVEVTLGERTAGPDNRECV